MKTGSAYLWRNEVDGVSAEIVPEGCTEGV